MAIKASCPRQAPIQLASWLPQTMVALGWRMRKIDDFVDARAAIPEVAGDDDLLDREVADHVRGGAEDLDLALLAHEGLDQRRVEGLAAVLDLAVGHELAEQADQGPGVDLLHVAARVAARERPDDLHLAADRPQHERLPIFLLCRLKPRVRLARIVNDRQELLELGRVDPPLEQALHQRAERARGVVDDVLELLVLPVDVADDVDRALGQGQHRLVVPNLGEDGVPRGVKASEGTEEGSGAWAVMAWAGCYARAARATCL